MVIGAGAIGLATARALSGAGLPTMVLEQYSHFGEENSSRHSEVIHAGIYYPTGSWKARFCVEGKKLLTSYVQERSIAHNRCGKIIIASDGNKAALKALFDKGVANGVDDLVMLTKKDVFALEPEVECDLAVLSPNTTIFDSHSVLLNYAADIENTGHSGIVYNCKVLGIKASQQHTSSRASSSQSRFVVSTNQGDIACDYLVNAGGLHAQYVASHITDYPTHLIPSPYFAKGNYYKLQRASSNSSSSSRAPFQRLIYPLPSQGGLGIHATLDLNGGVRFGPNVEWIQNPVTVKSNSDDVYCFPKDAPPYLNFAVNEHQAEAFCREIQTYYPSLRVEDLQPDYAGIRPKLCGPDGGKGSVISTENSAASNGGYVMKSAVDFVMHDHTVHGLKGLIQLYGIESPGMTSSMSIGAYVSKLLLSDDY